MSQVWHDKPDFPTYLRALKLLAVSLELHRYNYCQFVRVDFSEIFAWPTPAQEMQFSFVLSLIICPPFKESMVLEVLNCVD